MGLHELFPDCRFDGMILPKEMHHTGIDETPCSSRCLSISPFCTCLVYRLKLMSVVHTEDLSHWSIIVGGRPARETSRVCKLERPGGYKTLRQKHKLLSRDDFPFSTHALTLGWIEWCNQPNGQYHPKTMTDRWWLG